MDRIIYMSFKEGHLLWILTTYFIDYSVPTLLSFHYPFYILCSLFFPSKMLLLSNFITNESPVDY